MPSGTDRHVLVKDFEAMDKSELRLKESLPVFPPCLFLVP